MQESISVFTPDAEEESDPESDLQEFPWELPPNETAEVNDENIPQ